MTVAVNFPINTDTELDAHKSSDGTVSVRIDNTPHLLFLGMDQRGKAGALSVLARLTAAVEALPDDPEPLPLDEARQPCGVAAPVWRTLTFGDLRAGDVIKSDQDDDPETVERVLAYVRTDQSTHYRNADLVLVRHPRPEVGA